MKLFNLDKLAESRGDVLEQDREGEESVKRGEHDIHANDIEVVVKEDGTDEEKKTGVQSFGCVIQYQLLNLRLESFRIGA